MQTEASRAKSLQMMARVVLIEGCDFETAPRGGQLTFARQLIATFGRRLALVGWTAEPHRIGRWTERRIGTTTYDYFAIGMSEATRKPVLPARLAVYLLLRRWKRAILEGGARHALMSPPRCSSQ